MLPIDSATIALSVYKGFAWRDSLTGRYHYIMPANPTTSDIPVASTTPATWITRKCQRIDNFFANRMAANMGT